MTTVTGPRELPALEKNRELVIPPGSERTLANGLTVIAIERRSVPLVEVRLRVPFGRVNLDPPFVVNFEAEAAVRFLQVTVSVMTREPHIEELLKKNDPRIRNDLLMLLGGQKYATISTREGKEKLQADALEAVRAVVKSAGGEPEKIEALYFTAFVMQ